MFAAGSCTDKTMNAIRHDYHVNGTQIIAETWTLSGIEYLLYYLYDETGSPIGMQYRTSNYASQVFDAYFFEKNVQGDIIGVYNSTGKKIGAYTYDAWGKCSLSVANGNTILENEVMHHYNPFRYRGYYYDYETGFYYLQSRYYNPEWGRFLNADDSLYSSIFGFNLFVYCDNNPISYIDPSGEDCFSDALVGWTSAAWGLTLVDGPLPVGDIVYITGCAVLGLLAIGETIVLAEAVVDWVQEATDTAPDAPQTGGLPNQGTVSEDPEAPPVDAGKQGKHVPGHNNNTNPDKSTWRPGENGVKETQEAWKNGKEVPGRNGTVRIGTSSDGRTIKVHRDKSGNIHGYPIYPKS